MKHLYSIDYTDTVAANSTEQAIEIWTETIGESIDDYPDVDIQQIPANEWVSKGQIKKVTEIYIRFLLNFAL